MGRAYAKAHEMASDPSKVQQSGHKSETAWVNALAGWLPPQYQIGQRKYLLLEDDSAGRAISAETDIVIFQPSYPERLRNREEILVSGVAAAFSVKLTLDRAGISEAIQQAAMVRRGTKIRSYSVTDEVLPPLFYGILAHSHRWKQPGSNPTENITRALVELDQEHSKHPREGLDLVCVADLDCWSRVTTVSTFPEPGTPRAVIDPYGGVRSGFFVEGEPRPTGPPVATLISLLLNKLSYRDPTVKPIADGLRLTSSGGDGDGDLRHWYLPEALSRQAQEQLRGQPWGWEPVYE